MEELLTGKTKADFEEWFTKKDYIAYGRITIGVFWMCPETMQQGVLREYFETKGIEIVVRFGLKAGYYCEIFVDEEEQINLYDFPDYSTAFTTAIQKACGIINGGEG